MVVTERRIEMNQAISTDCWEATPTRELAFRAQDGLEVTLYWSDADNRLAVSVLDIRTEDSFVIPVENAAPLDVFNHPYAHAAWRGVPYRPLQSAR
jgi:hypothetical protein